MAYTSQCKKHNFFLEVSDFEEAPNSIDIVIKNFTADGYKKERSNWHLEASTSYISYATAKIYMKDLLITYDESPNNTTVVNCNTGIMNRNTNDLSLEGNVSVSSTNGRQLFTEKLFWESKKEELSSNVPVKIIYPNGEIIKGTGMKSNSTLSNIIIYNPIGVHPAGK